MKVELNGFITWMPEYQGSREGRFELLPWDVRTWEEKNRGGRIFVKEHISVVDVPDDFDPTQLQIADLEEAKAKARADFQARITELDRQINSLLAIENKVRP